VRLKDYKEKKMQDPEFAKAYDEIQPEMNVIRTIIFASNPGFAPKLTPFATRCMETYEKLKEAERQLVDWNRTYFLTRYYNI